MLTLLTIYLSLCRTAMGDSSQGVGQGSQRQYGRGSQVAAAGGTDYFPYEGSKDQGEFADMIRLDVFSCRAPS